MSPIKIINSFFRAILAAFFIFYLCSQISAQVVIEKKLDNGDDLKKYVWVILAEGYTEQEFEKFKSDTSFILDGFFISNPFKEYKSAFNIYTVFIPSSESGSDHPSSGIYVDTAFDATYESYGITRLLTVNDEKAFKAASQIKYSDVVIVLVNDEQYGGSGGAVIAVSTNQSSIEIALHEAGHVVGRLADEYETEYPGYPDGDYEPNVTYQVERTKVPWNVWIEPDVPLPTSEDYSYDVVGLYEGARYQPEGIYRPKKDCKMRSLNDPFCAICGEALVLKIYDTVSPIEKISPLETEIEMAQGIPVTFSVEPLKLDGGAYESLWEADNDTLEDELQTSLVLFPSFFKKGNHKISAWISDATDMVRTDSQDLLTSRHEWNVNKDFCSGKLLVSIADEKTGQYVNNATISSSTTNEPLNINSDGKYELPDTPCGEQTVTINSNGFASAERVILIADGETTALDITLKPNADNYYVTGNINGDFQRDVVINLSGNASGSAITGDNGSFIFGPLAPGEYTLTPDISGLKVTPESQNISVIDSDVSGIVFEVKKAGIFLIISGIIHGDVKEGVIVSVSGEKRSSVVTDNDGSFKFQYLSPGEYVLNPSCDGVIFEPPQIKVELAEEDLSELSFLAKESPCPATQILSTRSSYARTLRQFRDNVLRKNKKGSSLIHLYYLTGPEVSKILEKNPPLSQEALLILNECMPKIKLKLKGSDVNLSEKIRTDIKNFAGHLSLHGSPMLKKVIEQFLRDLDHGRFF